MSTPTSRFTAILVSCALLLVAWPAWSDCEYDDACPSYDQIGVCACEASRCTSDFFDCTTACGLLPDFEREPCLQECTDVRTGCCTEIFPAGQACFECVHDAFDAGQTPLCPAPNVCSAGDMAGIGNCDDVCDSIDEGASPDCDGVCNRFDDGAGPDCDGVCSPGDEAGSPDCNGHCGFADDAAGVDCNGVCASGDSQSGPDCNFEGARIEVLWDGVSPNIRRGPVGSTRDLHVVLTAGGTGSLGAGVTVDYSGASGRLSVVGIQNNPNADSSNALPLTLGPPNDTGSRVQNINARATVDAGDGLSPRQKYLLGIITFRVDSAIFPAAIAPTLTGTDDVFDIDGSVISETTTFNLALSVRSVRGITEIIDSTGDGGGFFSNLGDIEVDSDKNVYVRGYGDIFKISPSGSITAIGEGFGPENDIAIDSSGNVYAITDAKAFKITPSGTTTEILDLVGSGGIAISIDVDSVGNAYVGVSFTDKVLKISPGGTITEIIDATGDGNGNGLDGPVDITCDADGNVYVVGVSSNNAFRISPSGTITTILTFVGDLMGNPLQGPTAVAVDSSDNVFVVGRSDNGFKYKSRRVTEIIDSEGDGGGNSFFNPHGVAVGPNGNVYAFGTTSDNAFEITPSGTITEIIDSNGDRSGNILNGPLGIAADASGNVYVSGFHSKNVFKISRVCFAGDLPGAGNCDGVCDAQDEVLSADCDGFCHASDHADGPDCTSGLLVFKKSSGPALASAIDGVGIRVARADYVGSAEAAGLFAAGVFSGVSIPSGILLTTGSAELAVGPNQLSNSEALNFFLGDADLDAHFSGTTTTDASSLTLTFDTDGGDFSFRFAFASEEYDESGGANSDLFALFLNGENLALLPGTGEEVGIDTVNPSVNPNLFKDNSSGMLDIEYEGITQTFTATRPALSPNTYELKLVVADASDFRSDSAIFIGQIQVPEPAGLLPQLCALGVLALLVRRRRPHI